MTYNSPIPKKHINSCEEHGVVVYRDEGCPVCRTDAEAAPTAVSDIEFMPTDLQWQIEPETMLDLLPLLVADTTEKGEGPVCVAVAGLDRSRLPMGWQPQERWWNVVVVQLGNTSREVVKHESDARDAIEAITDGEGVVESPEFDFDRLDPDVWQGVAEPYGDVEFERVDDDTLRITITGIPHDSAYKTARRDLGLIAADYDLSIRTIEAGGWLEQGVIEVTTGD